MQEQQSQQLDQKKLAETLLRKPEYLKLELRDKSMLPKSMQDKDVIDIKITPPSLYTLTKCIEPLSEIPNDIVKAEPHKIDMKRVLSHADKISDICAVIINDGDPPTWYSEMLMKNLAPEELYTIMLNCVVKMQTDFFLSSIQLALSNPLVKKNTNPPTPTK